MGVRMSGQCPNDTIRRPGRRAGHSGGAVGYTRPVPDEIVPQRCVVVLPSTGEFDSRTYRIARTLHERGHEVTVLARWKPGLARHEIHPVGYPILRVEATAVDGSRSGADPARPAGVRLVACPIPGPAPGAVRRRATAVGRRFVRGLATAWRPTRPIPAGRTPPLATPAASAATSGAPASS